MIDGVLLALVVVLVIGGTSGGFWLLRGKKSQPRTAAKSPSDRAVGASSAHSPKSAAAASNIEFEEQSAALDRVRSALSELLRGISSSIGNLLGNAKRYNDSLEAHKQSLGKIATVQDLKELEKALFSQVQEVQTANEQYRKELAEANGKVEEQQLELDRLQSNVGVDSLTEIPNRRALDERMVEIVDRAKRYDRIFSAIMIDIDHFKVVNDKHGHSAGDRVLRAVAQLLKDNKRSSDFLARYGGEEFVLLLPETTLESAETLANKLRERVAGSNFQYQKKNLEVTISAGVGEWAAEKDTAEKLMDRIDKALYEAKRGGRNQVRVAVLHMNSE